MPSKSKPTAGLPRKEATENTVELGVAHDHGDGDKNHRHRLGLIAHRHTDDGHVEFEDGRPPEIIVSDPADPGSDPTSGGGVDASSYPGPSTGRVSAGATPGPSSGGEPATSWRRAVASPPDATPTDQLPAVAKAPEPLPGTSHEDWMNGEAERRAQEHRAAVAAGVTPEEIAEANDIQAWHPHILSPTDNGQAEPRPMPGGSIGHVVAGTALETLYGTPEDVADEKTHGGLAAQLLFEVAEQDWAHNRLGDAAKLIQVHGLFHHILATRGLLPSPAEVEAANGGGS